MYEHGHACDLMKEWIRKQTWLWKFQEEVIEKVKRIGMGRKTERKKKASSTAQPTLLKGISDDMYCCVP